MFPELGKAGLVTNGSIMPSLLILVSRIVLNGQTLTNEPNKKPESSDKT